MNDVQCFDCFKNKRYGRYGRCWGCPIMVECGCGQRSEYDKDGYKIFSLNGEERGKQRMIVKKANSLMYKMFCTQNLEEVVRDHDNKGYINFAVDFDGVLCESIHPGIGPANEAMIKYLIEQKRKGNKIILWTSRTDTDLQEAIDWSREHGLEFDHINEGDPVVEKMYGKPGCPTRKIYADVYIDDRNMAPLNIWPVQFEEE